MKIPKTFHRIWVGEDPIPDEFIYYGETWEKLHPDWEMKLWTDKNMPKLINQELFDVSPVVLRSDIARFEILYKYGGVYIDTDFECYKNIEPIIKDLEIFSAGEKEGVIGNAIMGAIPTHPVMLKLIKKAPKSIIKNHEYGPNVKTGPIFMTKTLSFEEIYVFGPEYFFPAPPATNVPPNQGYLYPKAYGMHHWAASWIGKEEKIGFTEWVVMNKDSKRFY